MEKAGSYTLPAIKFVWWNPRSQQLQTKSLPAVTFEIAPSKQSAKPAESETSIPWIWIIAFITFSVLLLWQRRSIQAGFLGLYNEINSPERVATRRLLKACRDNNAKSAYEAWLDLPKIEAAVRLNDAIQELVEVLYSGRTNSH